MLIGAHVSTRGGIDRAIDNALAVGAEVFQTHPTPPQQWRQLVLDEAVVESFRSKLAASGRRAHYIHAPYLVNLATAKDTLRKQSVTSLAHSLDLAGRLGAAGVIFHPGSHLGAGFDGVVEQMGQAIREILARTDSPAQLIVENSAGAGGCVGCSFDEVGRIVDAARSDRVGVCLDTAHLFASGYEIRSPEDVAQTLESFDRAVGLQRLTVVHANDSKTALGSNTDRHANIGEGEIGLDPFRWLLADERLAELPWILEVPGLEGKGPDLENVNRLRDCAGLPRISAPQPASA